MKRKGRFSHCCCWLFCGLILTTLLAACAAPARAGASGEFPFAQPYFETVGDSESIPYGLVTTMAQDTRGFLWMGTQAGLIRYDGYRLRKFAHSAQDSSSVAADYVQAIAAAKDGRVWIGTANDGISVFDPATERFEHIRHDPGQPDSLGAGRINAMVLDAAGNLWVGSDQGLDFLAANSKRFIHYRHDGADTRSLADNRVLSLLLDREQQLWIGSADGLQKRRPGGKTFERADTQPATGSAPLHGEEVISLLHARDGKLWFGTRKHGAGWLDPQTALLHRLLPDPLRPEALNHGRVSAIGQPSDQHIWLATYGGGINVVSANDGKVLQHVRQDVSLTSSLAMDNIGSLLLDRSGMMWIGTWGNGLQRYNTRNTAIRILRHSPGHGESLSHADVSSMLELADGHLLVGTRGNGIDIFDRKRGLVGSYRPAPGGAGGALQDAAITAMVQTPDGTLWVGTQQAGVLHLQPGSGEWQVAAGLPDVQVRRLYVDHGGNLWVGSNAGLARWQAERQRFETLSNEDGSPMRASIYTLTGDRAGRIFAGSHTGLWVVEPGSQVMHGVHPEAGRTDSLASNEIRGLLLDSRGQLWIDTPHGLELMRNWNGKQGQFEHISARLGRPDMYFGSNLLEDKHGRIWTQWFVLDPKAMQLYTLSKADGLDIGTAWIGSFGTTRDGLFMYGGTQGLAIIDPEQFQPWDYAPQVVVTDLKINGQAQPLGRLGLLGGVSAGARRAAMASPSPAENKAGTNGIPPAANGTDTRANNSATNNAVQNATHHAASNPATTRAGATGDEAEKSADNNAPRAAGDATTGDAGRVLLSLTPEQRNFTIEFAALDFSAPQKNRYRYRLQGYDKEWIEVDAEHRSASYGNLWPGTYTLQVRGRNRVGDWGQNELTIPIRVLPAFWQTSWFLVLMLLLLAGTVVGGYRWRLARLRAEALVLQNLIAARTADILKLGKIGQELTATLDTEQAFERIYRHIRARLDAYVFMIGIYDEHKQQIVYVYEIENGQRQPVASVSLDERDRPAVWCVRERREMITATRSGFLNYVSTILPPSIGAPMETVVYLPLMLEQQVIGCLTVQSPRQHAYSSDQLEFLRVLASYTAIAVANASAHGKLTKAHLHLQETQSKLVESEKLASLGGLVSGIAHEINTPLGTSLVAISGGLDSWRNLRGMIAHGRISKSALEACTQEGIEYATLALRTASRAAELVTVFKSIALKPSSDHVVDLEMNSYLQEAAISVHEVLEHHGSHVEIEVPNDLHAEIVPDALLDALNCVFSNVVDHAFTDGRTGTLHVAAYMAHETELVIEVADNGHGIAASDLPKVFDPFFSTKGGNQHHVGLGLYVAYNHVTQRLGGRISISSEEGVGTTVSIHLPCGEEAS